MPAKDHSLGESADFDPTRAYTLEEWQALEQALGRPLEFWNGQLIDIRGMAGGTLAHTRIIANAYRALANALEAAESPCEAFVSELKVEAERAGKYFYPDTTVSCDPEEGSVVGSITNPTLVVEAISDSSYDRDTRGKFRAYAKLPSLLEYVLLDTREVDVTVYSRRSGERQLWRIDAYTALDERIALRSLGITLNVGQLYARVFEEPQGPDLVAEERVSYS